ncbi:MAG: hypothetical protein V3V13_11725 [Paracoccaceae bacterium]
MFKIIRLATAGVFAAGSAFAGAVAYVAPAAPVMMEEPSGSMGSSGAWIIPLLAIGLICLAICGGTDDTPQGSGG